MAPPFRCGEGGSGFQTPVEVFIGSGQRLQLRLHLSLQGGELGLVTALALFGEGLQGLSLALVGLLAEGMALFHDADVELELLLALLLPALKPAAEDLQEGGASSEGGQPGDDTVHELAHAGGPRDLQAIAGAEGETDLHHDLLRKRPARRETVPSGWGVWGAS